MPHAAADDSLRSLAANLEATMRTYAASHGDGCVWERPEAIAVYSGRPGAIFNSVLLTAPVASEPVLRDVFAWANALYAARKARWSLWLAEHFLTPDLLGAVPSLLEPYKLAAQHRSQGMVASALAGATRVLPPLDFLPVLAPAARFDFCHIMSQAFDTALSTYVDVYQQTAYWDGPLRGFVAYDAGQAVSCACYLASAGSIGLYGVATLPSRQRRGCGESIVRHAVAEARRATGLTRLVLEASDRAAPLYRRLGFRRVTGVTVYNESR